MNWICGMAIQPSFRFDRGDSCAMHIFCVHILYAGFGFAHIEYQNGIEKSKQILLFVLRLCDANDRAHLHDGRWKCSFQYAKCGAIDIVHASIHFAPQIHPFCMFRMLYRRGLENPVHLHVVCFYIFKFSIDISHSYKTYGLYCYLVINIFEWVISSVG